MQNTLPTNLFEHLWSKLQLPRQPWAVLYFLQTFDNFAEAWACCSFLLFLYPEDLLFLLLAASNFCRKLLSSFLSLVVSETSFFPEGVTSDLPAYKSRAEPEAHIIATLASRNTKHSVLTSVYVSGWRLDLAFCLLHSSRWSISSLSFFFWENPDSPQAGASHFSSWSTHRIVLDP